MTLAHKLGVLVIIASSIAFLASLIWRPRR